MKIISSKVKCAIYISLIASSVTYANAAANQCLGDPNTPIKQGNGTKSNPFKLVYGYDLCDITLVKADEAEGKNLSYPDDTIYFQYDFKNIPYQKDGDRYDNGFVTSLAMNENSSVTVNPVTSTPSASCAIAYDDKANKNSNYQYNYYDGGCGFNKPDNSPNTFSGSIKFSISIDGSQQIKRETDSSGNLKKGPHGGYLGAGVVGINWVKAPVYSPFSLEH